MYPRPEVPLVCTDDGFIIRLMMSGDVVIARQNTAQGVRLIEDIDDKGQDD